MKNLFAIGFVSLLALTGCSSAASTPSADGSAAVQESEASGPAALDLNGTWEQANKKSEENYHAAEIADGVITVNWVAPDTRSLYWVGSVPIENTDEPFTWTSQGDVEAMASALMASTEDSKEFSYADGVLSYEVTAMGTTMTIKMERK